MKLMIFCVKDTATQLYGTPMFLISQGQAVRSFSDEANRQSADNQLWMHPDDFELYHVGDFDGESGTFDTIPPALVVRGKDVAVREDSNRLRSVK